MKIFTTENYVRNFIKISAGNIPSEMYHITSKENVPQILKEGLKMNKQGGFTGQWIDEYYGGIRPIFLSKDPWFRGIGPENAKNFVIIKVNVYGLKFTADVVSLDNYGAYYDPDKKVFYWDEDETDRAGSLIRFFDEMGEISLRKLLRGGAVTRAAIELTGDIAVLQDIPPEKIIGIVDINSNELSKTYNTYKEEKKKQQEEEKKEEEEWKNK